VNRACEQEMTWPICTVLNGLVPVGGYTASKISYLDALVALSSPVRCTLFYKMTQILMKFTGLYVGG